MLSRPDLILKLIVEQYLLDGLPVSSKAIASHHSLDVSSATVRNTMVQLEGMGFICSPHTSAGRVPTTEGFRHFIDKLLKLEHIPQSWQDELERHLVPQLPVSLLCQRAGQLLTNLTGLVSLFSAPKAAGRIIRQVDLIRLSTDRLLLLVTDEEGDVLQRILALPAVDATTLSRCLCLLNGALCGQQWQDGLTRLQLILRQEQAAVLNVLSAVVQQLSHDESQQHLPLVFGRHRLLQLAEHHQDPAVNQLLTLLEQPDCLMQMLAPLTQDGGTKLILGQESGVEELHNVSIIVAPYQLAPHRFFAILGPRRMNYARLIPLVEACGQLLAKHLNHGISSP
jgi:heat-inducible transcriptional repressor